LSTGQNGWFITFDDNSTLTIVDSFFDSVDIDNGYVTFEMTDGRSFMFKIDSNIVIPKLLSMEFRAVNNPKDLIEDAVCTIVGDSVVDCWIPNITDSKQLIANLSFDGDKVMADNQELESGNTIIDYRAPVKLEVLSAEDKKEYTVYVHAFTGLPILWIETEGREEIVSKEDYLKAHFRLVEDVVTRGPGDVIEVEGKIKGRGNSTWKMDKKPYRLKFDSKVSFLDEPKDKSWVLLANYTDKTSLRNATALFMGSISNLEYTPRFHFVDVMLNGRYNGTYQLGDKIKISKDRVNVGDDGFLMEIDSKAVDESDARYFMVSHIEQPVNIKDPDVEYGDEAFNYAKDFVTLADKVLFSDNFTDPEEGWQKYLDIDSFVDWYLINEITKNNDGIFYSSCYMNLKRGGKLRMGPLWDFDVALGNVDYNKNYEVEGLWVYKVRWYNRLFEDPEFKARVKERFDYFYGRRDDILKEINENARYLKLSVIEDENRWHTFYNYTWPNYDIWGSYMNEVQSMKTWLSRRFEWLKTEFDKM
ncbi:MAG: CotH kinase family protein, partial [Muribaculaceae bacterium]|nr:CotH kinase family protein [Muribaculaceae bacterium]